MPSEMVFRPRADLLSFEEIHRLLTIFAGIGVRRVRFTGGEPLVRANVIDLIRAIADIEGIERLAMTSNGHLLPEMAGPLAAAGLDEINISIDTLNSERFKQLTRRGDVEAVLAGIDAAIAAGLRVKLNAVALASIPTDELADLCAYAWEREVVPRFIEHMPMSSGELFDSAQNLHATDLRDAIRARFGGPLETVPSADTSGPARYWRLPDGRMFGIISAMSEHFCDTCNRVRLSAIGELHPCLAFDDAISLRDVIRSGGSDDEVREAIADALAGKRRGHEFGLSGGGAPTKHMIGIGG
jgi:cyclic pyranopterin phosphate synthase